MKGTTMKKIIVIAAAAIALAGCSDTVSSTEPTTTTTKPSVEYNVRYLDEYPPGSHPVGQNPLDVMIGGEN